MANSKESYLVDSGDRREPPPSAPKSQRQSNIIVKKEAVYIPYDRSRLRGWSPLFKIARTR